MKRRTFILCQFLLIYFNSIKSEPNLDRLPGQKLLRPQFTEILIKIIVILYRPNMEYYNALMLISPNIL